MDLDDRGVETQVMTIADEPIPLIERQPIGLTPSG